MAKNSIIFRESVFIPIFRESYLNLGLRLVYRVGLRLGLVFIFVWIGLHVA